MALAHGLEGWCTDPTGAHEERWFSWGQATKLVRDAGVESFDEPNGSEVVAAQSVPWGDAAQRGIDLLRSDRPTTGNHEHAERITLAVLTGVCPGEPR